MFDVRVCCFDLNSIGGDTTSPRVPCLRCSDVWSRQDEMRRRGEEGLQLLDFRASSWRKSCWNCFVSCRVTKHASRRWPSGGVRRTRILFRSQALWPQHLNTTRNTARSLGKICGAGKMT
ncbi:unnamed protein product [Ectocarpus sp. 13 AM-2016]